MNRKPPPIQWLPVFDAAARHVSFRKAAQELCVSPPAISQQIKALEAYLGVALFDRSKRRLRLTEEGTQYHFMVSDMLETLRMGHRDFCKRHEHAVFHLSAPIFIAQEMLIPNYNGFKQYDQKHELRVTTGNELISFEDDRFDAAVRFGIGNWPELHCQKIWDVEIGLVCGKRYIEESGIQGNLPFTKEALSRHTLISLDEDLGDWQSIFPDIEPRDRIVCDSYFAAVRSAEEGLGIAVGLQPVINSWINSGRLMSICNPVHSQTRAYWLVAKQGQSESAAHKAVYSWLRDLFADLANKS